MKEFKKWEGTHSPGEYAYQTWEEAWRAALEWVHSQMVGISPCSEPRQICENIEQELQNGST